MGTNEKAQTQPELFLAARLKAGMTQQEASIAIGCTLSEISRYECGHVVPKADRVFAMARAYGVPMESLMGAPAAVSAGTEAA